MHLNKYCRVRQKYVPSVNFHTGVAWLCAARLTAHLRERTQTRGCAALKIGQHRTSTLPVPASVLKLTSSLVGLSLRILTATFIIMREVLLFGFGALLHPSKTFPRSPECVVVRAPSHRLSFAHQLGYATLEPLDEDIAAEGIQQHASPGCACGVVYSLRQAEVDELIKRERGCNRSDQPKQCTLTPVPAVDAPDASHPDASPDVPDCATRRRLAAGASGAD